MRRVFAPVRALIVGGAALLAAASGAWSLLTPAAAGASPAPIGQLVPSGSGEALGPTAISGDTVFSGAPDTTLQVQDQGAVFVFARAAAGGGGTQNEVAVLSADDPAVGDRLGEWVAADGPDVVAGGASGRLYVFAPPAGGWSGEVHQTAVLSASDGAKLTAPVVSGQTIVAQGGEAGRPSSVYVFTEPAGGWSGVVHEAAKLTASDGTPDDMFGAAIAASGATIVVGAPQAHVGTDTPGALYVFTEPAGGWAGALHETAKLTGSDITTHLGLFSVATDFGASVAISGSTIVGARPFGAGPGSGAAYVFSEPPGGWASETQTAKLVAAGGLMVAGSPLVDAGRPGLGTPALAISGDTIVVPGSLGSTLVHPAEFVFTEPSGGWSGTQSQAATLVASDGGELGSPTISGQEVTAGELAGASGQTVIGRGAAYVFTEPAGGWSGTVNETAKLADPGGGPPPGGLDLYSEPLTGWSSAEPSAVLLPSGDPRPVSLSSVAVSGTTAVADQLGSAYVFTEPAAGWGPDQPSATLSDPGAQLGTVAISGSAIAALADASPSSIYAPTMGAEIDVFAEPAGGWSGRLAPAAHLIASDGATLVALAIDGATVFAAGEARGRSSVYVFSEPAGGWAGTIHETARLLLPSTGYPHSISSDGSEVIVNGVLAGSVAAGVSQGYVFTEPAGGWRGRLPASATLSPGYFDGTVQVYREPGRGWSGRVSPSGRLLISRRGMYANELAISDDTIGVAAFVAPGKYESCPCGGGIWLFSRPATGWTGNLTAPEFVPATTDGEARTGLALDGSVLFAGGQATPVNFETVLDLYSVPSKLPEHAVRAGRPRVSSQPPRGLLRRRPRLAFLLRAGRDAPPIESVTIAPPSGLRFTSARRGGVLVDGLPARTARVRGGRLALRLAFPVGRVTLTLSWPALVESRAERARIRRFLIGRHGRAARLILSTDITVTDASRHVTRLRVRSELPAAAA